MPDTNLTIRITGDSRGAKRAFQEVQRISQATGAKVRQYAQQMRVAYDKVGKQLSVLQAKTLAVGKSVSSAGKKLYEMRGQLTAISVAAVAVGAAFNKVIQTTSTLEYNIAKVSTLLDTSTVSMERLRGAALSISSEVGKSPAELSDALFDIVSAGVSAADSVDVLRHSSRLATAGFAGTKQVADALTTVINAYGLQASEAGKISDILFKTQEKGKTTIAELASAIGRVTPIAASAGVGFDELGASLATLTAGGLNTNESVNAMRALLVSILDPTADAQKEAKRLGIEWNAAALQAKGLKGVLDDLKAAGGANNETLAVLTREITAMTAALTLTGPQADKFNSNIGAISKSAGATDAGLKKIMATFRGLTGVMKAEFAKLLVEIGEDLMPVLKQSVIGLTHTFKTLGQVLSSLPLEEVSEGLGSLMEQSRKHFTAGGIMDKFAAAQAENLAKREARYEDQLKQRQAEFKARNLIVRRYESMAITAPTTSAAARAVADSRGGAARRLDAIDFSGMERLTGAAKENAAMLDQMRESMGITRSTIRKEVVPALLKLSAVTDAAARKISFASAAGALDAGLAQRDQAFFDSVAANVMTTPDLYRGRIATPRGGFDVGRRAGYTAGGLRRQVGPLVSVPPPDTRHQGITRMGGFAHGMPSAITQSGLDVRHLKPLGQATHKNTQALQILADVMEESTDKWTRAIGQSLNIVQNMQAFIAQGGDRALGTAGAIGGILTTLGGAAGGQDTRGGRALSGAGQGVAAGAAIGSIVPGIGTVAGGIAGGVLGGIGGLFSNADAEVGRFQDSLVNAAQSMGQSLADAVRQGLVGPESIAAIKQFGKEVAFQLIAADLTSAFLDPVMKDLAPLIQGFAKDVQGATPQQREAAAGFVARTIDATLGPAAEVLAQALEPIAQGLGLQTEAAGATTPGLTGGHRTVTTLSGPALDKFTMWENRKYNIFVEMRDLLTRQLNAMGGAAPIPAAQGNAAGANAGGTQIIIQGNIIIQANDPAEFVDALQEEAALDNAIFNIQQKRRQGIP